MLTDNFESVPCDCLEFECSGKCKNKCFLICIVDSLGPSQLTGCMYKISDILCFMPGICIIVNLFCHAFFLEL